MASGQIEIIMRCAKCNGADTGRQRSDGGSFGDTSHQTSKCDMYDLKLNTTLKDYDDYEFEFF